MMDRYWAVEKTFTDVHLRQINKNEVKGVLLLHRHVSRSTSTERGCVYSIITDRASTLITSYRGRCAITVSANSRGQRENKYFGARSRRGATGVCARTRTFRALCEWHPRSPKLDEPPQNNKSQLAKTTKTVLQPHKGKNKLCVAVVSNYVK